MRLGHRLSRVGSASTSSGAAPAGVPITDDVVGAAVTFPNEDGDFTNLSAVACPDASGCSAFGISVSQLCLPNFPCINPTELEALDLAPNASLTSESTDSVPADDIDGVGNVSCPSSASCYVTGYVVGNAGVLIPILLTTSNSSTVAGIPNGTGTFGIACTSASSCVGVGQVTASNGDEGAVDAVNNGQPTTAVAVPGISGPQAGLSRVSCPMATGCFAVGTTTVNGANEGVLVSLTPPSTTMALPPSGAVLSGSETLDAAASDGVAVTSVDYVLTGGTYNGTEVSGSVPTIFGWLSEWNTTTLPNGTYTLQSVATNAEGFSTASAADSVTVDNPPPTSTVVIPSGGATVSGGSSVLDAVPSAYVSNVTYEISGGTLDDQVVATGAATLFGWLAKWNTTTVPNGTYSLVSVAAYPNGVSTTSSPVAITVDNAPPTTAVLVPKSGATVSGTSSVLDASTSANVSSLSYELSGGPSVLDDQVIATGTLGYYGWVAEWNTTSVPDGTYSLVSVAAYPNGVSTASPPVTITVDN